MRVEGPALAADNSNMGLAAEVAVRRRRGTAGWYGGGFSGMELNGGLSVGISGSLTMRVSSFLCSKCSILKGTVNNGSWATSDIMFLQKQSVESLHRPHEPGGKRLSVSCDSLSIDSTISRPAGVKGDEGYSDGNGFDENPLTGLSLKFGGDAMDAGDGYEA